MVNESSERSLARELQGKRVGVVLSAGFFGFYGHAGFMAAVEGVGLKPQGYAGTSAGALVASLAAAGMDAEAIAARLLVLQRGDFWDPAPITWLMEVIRGRIPTGLLSGKRFRRLLEESLPIRKIEEAEQPLVIVTTDVTHARAQVHTEGDLVEAVCASCAYPGLFRVVESGKARLWDGGIIDKAPLRALAERCELDALLVHYLPSRVTAEPATKPAGYLGAMGRAMAAARHSGFELQAQLCEAKGLPVYVIAPSLPAISPRRLSRGREVIGHATAAAAKAFAAPARLSRPFDPQGFPAFSHCT